MAFCDSKSILRNTIVFRIGCSLNLKLVLTDPPLAVFSWPRKPPHQMCLVCYQSIALLGLPFAQDSFTELASFSRGCYLLLI